MENPQEEKAQIRKKVIFAFVIGVIVLLGIIFRLKGLLINPSMWRDECALAYNIKFKTYLELFGHMRFSQVAPPLFLVATKFLVNLFNVQNAVGLCDLVMRIIPFLSGCMAIGVFYLVAKEVFQTKKAIVLALILFATNKILIDYCIEFKQYSSDMLFSLITILFFIKINMEKINYKQIALASIGFAMTLWFSFVSLFFVVAGFLSLLLKRRFIKKIVLMGLPLFVSLCVYLNLYVFGTYSSSGKVMLKFWADKFILPNFSNFFPLLVENIRYFFSPANAILFVLILSIYGIFLYFKSPKRDFITVTSLAFVALIGASVSHVYPFSERLVLFLIPIFILLMVKPLDELKANKFKTFVLSILLFFVMFPQVQFAFANLSKPLNKGDFSKEMMIYMEENIKPDDVIFVNSASVADYEYYSSFFDFKNKMIDENLGNIPNQKYLDFLNNLPKGNYWLFLPYDYSPQAIMVDFIKDWAKTNTTVISLSQATHSTLMYVSIH